MGGEGEAKVQREGRGQCLQREMSKEVKTAHSDITWEGVSCKKLW